MTIMTFRSAAAGALAALCLSAPALAHGVAGDRFFPATLAVDDPAVADELSLPTLSSLRSGEDPSVRETEISGEYSKRITDKLGVSFEGAWTHLPHAEGFQNLETSVKYQFLTDARHEAILSAGLGVEWGGTGAERVGAEGVSAITPTLFFGKGAGDLPDSLAWARPFALTGLVGYAIPTRAHSIVHEVDPDTGEAEEEIETNARVLSYGFTLQYSLPYLNAHVRDLGLPDAIDRITPLVEFAFERPVGRGLDGRTTGTVNPGLLWTGRKVQLGAEAVIPINRDSGRGVGFSLQLHLFLDDLFPTSLGRPLIGGGQ